MATHQRVQSINVQEKGDVKEVEEEDRLKRAVMSRQTIEGHRNRSALCPSVLWFFMNATYVKLSVMGKRVAVLLHIREVTLKTHGGVEV
jgi:hypothetical protein